jgi:hypothetical protein
MELGKSTSVLMRSYRKDGTMFWNAMDFEPRRDANGHIVHFSGSIQDVTEQINGLKATQPKIREMRDRCPDAALADIRQAVRALTE